MLKIFEEESPAEDQRSYWEENNAQIYHYFYTQTQLLLNFAKSMPAYALLQEWFPSEGLIVDAGCACQEIACLFETEQRKFLGIDFAVQTLKSGKKVFPPATYLAGDLHTLPLANESIPFVLAKGIAEHFEEGPAGFLQEIKRVLKPQGTLLLITNTANAEDYCVSSSQKKPYPHLMKKLLFRRASDFKIDGQGFHAYAFRKRQVKKILEENGFRVLRHHSIGFFDGLMRSRRFGERVKQFATQRRIAMVQGKPASKSWQFFDDLFLRERVHQHPWKRLLLNITTRFYRNYDAFLCETKTSR